MRYVDRAQVAPPASLTDPAGAGLTEYAKAQLHYQAPDAAAFSFKAYKSPDVIAALATLFHRKCAYCESSYAAVHPMDVEHYRPKGAVFGAAGHPGYWWLAAEWTNLLPSCIDCNRRRYQDLYRVEQEGGDVTMLLALAGKQDIFPIAGAQRADRADAPLQDEDALLIDPCRRDPALHLAWATTHAPALGLAQAVVTARKVDGADDPYASASIAVYGLNRSGLVDARTDLIRKLAYDLEDLQLMIKLAANQPPDQLADALAHIAAKAERLAQCGGGAQPYSACARAFLQARLAHLVATLDTLREQCRQDAPP